MQRRRPVHNGGDDAAGGRGSPAPASHLAAGRRARCPRWRVAPADAGAISLFVAVLFVAFLLVTGVVIDSAELRGQRRALSDLARQAARAAVQEVDATFYRATGTVRLDAAAAVAAAKAVAARSGLEAAVTVRGDRATVRLSRDVGVRVLGTGGRHVTVSTTDEARATWGVSAARR